MQPTILLNKNMFFISINKCIPYKYNMQYKIYIYAGIFLMNDNNNSTLYIYQRITPIDIYIHSNIPVTYDTHNGYVIASMPVSYDKSVSPLFNISSAAWATHARHPFSGRENYTSI